MNVLPSQPAVKPKQSWFRFTLRTFLLGVLVLGVACGWLGSHISRQHNQRRVVRQLLAHGHSVNYDYEFHEDPSIAGSPPGPWLLRKCFGDDLFAHAMYVTLQGTHHREDFRALLELPMLSDVTGYRTITDPESLADIARIPKLRTLSLEAPGEILGELAAAQELEALFMFDMRVSDADLEFLPRLAKLRYLTFRRSGLTAPAMAHVGRMSQLRSLRIHDDMSIDDAALAPIGKLYHLEHLALLKTNITDEGLKHLRSLKQLKELDLRTTNVTDEGIVHLAGFEKLQDLKLSVKIGDAGLQRLTSIQSMRCLHLHGSSITDEGMKSLAQLPRLKEIHIPYAKVTDAGILELRTLKELERVSVGSNVTLTGAAKLREHLPNCQFDGVSANGSRSFFLPALKAKKVSAP